MMKTLSKLTAIAIFCTAPVGLANADTSPYYFGLDYSWYSADHSRNIDNAPLAIPDTGDGLGVNFGYIHDELWDFRFSWKDLNVDSEGPGAFEYDGSIIGLDAIYSLSERSPFYISAGYNYLRFDDADSNDALSLGAGFQHMISDNFRLRAEAKRYFGITDSLNSDVTFSFGVDYLFGGKSTPTRKDSDRDGIYDSLDQCPNSPAGARVNAQGCGDADGDGVINTKDRCPGTPKGQSVDSQGCPINNDSDNDGVLNADDQCPATPAGRRVDATGCSDADKDGVYDNQDACPGTIAGASVDARGCIVKTETIELEVLFDNDSSAVTSQYMTQLQQVADYMQRYPEVTMELAGHTSIVGDPSYNQNLSIQRAESVKNILVQQLGVASNRITIVGYGESRPLVSGNSASAHRANRRIDATFSN